MRGVRLGVLGGMGPLASAEFLDTIYRLNAFEVEQSAPACILLSDPSFPDRTEAILAGTTERLTEQLTGALEELCGLGATRIVIACVTIHHVLPKVPESLRRKVVSLIDLVVEEVLSSPRPFLLLATDGTRAARIFERHERWEEIERWVSFPGERDQRDLHDWIYRLKGNGSVEDCSDWLESLLARYGAEGCIFGCTELHLLHRPLARGASGVFDSRVVDPLLIAARDLSALLSR